MRYDRKEKQLADVSFRHDVTEGTRDLIKDATSDIKQLSQYQTTDPKKTVK